MRACVRACVRGIITSPHYKTSIIIHRSSTASSDHPGTAGKRGSRDRASGAAREHARDFEGDRKTRRASDRGTPQHR